MSNSNFVNIPPTDFTIPAEREALALQIDIFQKHIANKPKTVTGLASGKKLKSKQVSTRLDPNDARTVLAEIHMASLEQMEDAIQKLRQARKHWAKTPVKKRADILRKAASIMHKDMHRLSAIMIHESGKPWLEADRDVAEAIDFCNYYADQAEEQLIVKKTDDTPGENNLYFYDPRGVAAIIGPWNFPLAIPCGMLTAALVTGNTAILKPSNLSSLIAQELVTILVEAGLPEDVVAFLPCSGAVVGKEIVKSACTDLICFTGSLAVGQGILSEAAIISEKRPNIKKTILELGGKNAIIVDEDADLDEAIKGVMYSAFGYAGQKCSACSRCILVGTVKDSFLERFLEAAKDIIITQSYKSESYMGPVIDKQAQENILSFIDTAKTDANLLYQSDVPEEGCFVPLTIFGDVAVDHQLFQEEIFGPVLSISTANNIDDAISLANNSAYALTGGFFSRSPKNIERVIEELKVGNLYINRNCTGAIVNRQPFGGFKLSGIGSKAGGPDYLKQFTIPRSLCENTLRKGFTPDL